MKIFWPEFPYVFKEWVKQLPGFTQTQEQIDRMFAKAEAKKARIRERNRLNGLGFINVPPNHRDVVYTSTRGERRRYQQGRD